MKKSYLKLPTRKGWCAVWFDDKGKMYVIPNSERRTKASAETIALNYQFEHLVKVDVAECCY